ncbi:MAG: type II secretion system protein GspL, partial [Gammaproteobacteria bacterium]|nr:type II secretion system protein GspL [Gammaproteobacteria bacterium]
MQENTDSVEWTVLDGHGNRIGFPQQGELTETEPLSRLREVIVIVPGIKIITHDVKMPGKNTKRILQAVPFALEEQLVDDIDKLHFALGPINDGTVTVAVVAKSMLETWLQTLAECGITPHALLPDYLALPGNESEWCIAIDRQQILIKHATAGGFSACASLADALLAAQLRRVAEENKPGAVTFIKSNADEAVAENLLQQLADAGLNVNAMDAEQNLIGKMT